MQYRFFLLLIFASQVAWAEPLENYLGWDLTKNTSDSSSVVNEDGSYSTTNRGDFYTLTPPDRRNPISIDAITASRLRAGQADPERVYQGGGANAQASTQATGGGDAIVPAGTFAPLDDLKTTATASDGGVLALAPPPPPKPAETHSSSSGSSSSGGTGGGGVYSSNAAKYAAAASGVPDNGYKGVSDSAKQLADAQAAAASGGGVNPLERPTAQAPSEADKNFGDSVSRAQAEALGFKTPTDKDGKPVEALKPVDEFGGTVGGNKQMSGFGFNGNKEGKDGKEAYGVPATCPGGSKSFDKPGVHRLSIPRGCTNLTIQAWGAGGGKGFKGGGGGAASFSMGRTDFDGSQFDIVVVVGAPGENGTANSGGVGGFPGGGAGGESKIAGGGGGGGYSGVFKVHKKNNQNLYIKENAILVAAGGGGGGGAGSTTVWGFRGNRTQLGRGEAGMAGGAKTAGDNSGNGEEGKVLFGGNGGNGNTVEEENCTTTVRNGFATSETRVDCNQQANRNVPFGIYNQQINRNKVVHNYSGGGGGGGGITGGGGGGAGGHGGGGGACLAAPLVPIIAAGKGTKPGYEHFPERGDAGEPGQHGRVKVDF